MTPQGEASRPDASAPGSQLCWLVLTNQHSSSLCRVWCAMPQVGMLPSTAFKENWSQSLTVGSKKKVHLTSHCLQCCDSIEAHRKVMIDGLHGTVHLLRWDINAYWRSTLKATKKGGSDNAKSPLGANPQPTSQQSKACYERYCHSVCWWLCEGTAMKSGLGTLPNSFVIISPWYQVQHSGYN